MSRITILLLSRELCQFGICQHIWAVDDIFVETALGKCLESGEKDYISQRKTAPSVVKTMFWKGRDWRECEKVS